MRSKVEIKEMIQKVLKARERAKILPVCRRGIYVQLIDNQIRALRWALGYKQPVYYFCTRCQINHRNLRCPQCGNDALWEEVELVE